MIDLNMGIDIGSTTVKVVVQDRGQVIFQHYERHLSQVREKAVEILKKAENIIGNRPFTVAVSGSAGLGTAKAAGLSFVQEVYATGQSVKTLLPGANIVIELGGEDAKILFLTGGLEERMNGTCAGGTGAFIDQMATLLNVDLDELDRLSLEAEKLYPIASRCGVFAKSDIQPLLNQAASKANIAASIFQAVVDQTITGLAQGRSLDGKIAFLGGPLFFFKGLQKRFAETLGLTEETALFPQWGQFAVAIGAAMYSRNAEETETYQTLLGKLEGAANITHDSRLLEPLFENQNEYDAFAARHALASVELADIKTYTGNAYLGVDCGSTTIKLVLIGDDAQILYQYYSSNQGSPIDLIHTQLQKIWALCGDRIKLCSSVVTGYGEELMKNAFHMDAGVVETMAHFRATRYFRPNVDFILDIGGQDIKCFKIKNQSIDSIMLNEACSSGCGSFIETFAKSMGYDIETFSKLGILAKHPVDLGSRCTVFMNSSVKQAQKEGATVGDISAGLSMSVVKNAIYKVIRARSAEELGKNIVVQGGTFYNDAVLRSFERELGAEVTRPSIAGLMGAFGAALHGRELKLDHTQTLSEKELQSFAYTSKPVVCNRCTNHCNLTVIAFPDGKRHIAGNKCDRPVKGEHAKELPNLYAFKRERIQKLATASKPEPAGEEASVLKAKPSEKALHASGAVSAAQPASEFGKRGKIGIPLGLNLYENIPFWFSFLTELGFEVVLSSESSTTLYRKGCRSIPSDTACYPAKLMHGHIIDLLEKGVDTIFYPCLTYNIDEKRGDNHFNCPVVAYYPELLKANIRELSNIRFLYPFFDLNLRRDFCKKAHAYFREYYPDLKLREIRKAADQAYQEAGRWQDELMREGEKAIAYARAHDLPVVVLAGRPYHIDAEINHGIDRMLSSFGLVVVSEDCVSDLVSPQKVGVLNQWTYHARLYNAAKYCTLHENTELVQLVSFGCGIDAITTDEVREILEQSGRFYTQLKIDEISNLGAIRIRIRSLLGAIDEKKKQQAQSTRKEEIR